MCSTTQIPLQSKPPTPPRQSQSASPSKQARDALLFSFYLHCFHSSSLVRQKNRLALTRFHLICKQVQLAQAALSTRNAGGRVEDLPLTPAQLGALYDAFVELQTTLRDRFHVVDKVWDSQL